MCNQRSGRRQAEENHPEPKFAVSDLTAQSRYANCEYVNTTNLLCDSLRIVALSRIACGFQPLFSDPSVIALTEISSMKAALGLRVMSNVVNSPDRVID